MSPRPTAPSDPGVTLGDRALYLAGVAGLAFSIAVVWLTMRAVMDIGGSCGSGGPYEIAVPCPDGVDLLLFLAFPLGFLSVGVIVWKGARLGPTWVGLAALAWPALFLSLGWNFIEYGLWPPYPSGIELGFLIPGVIFLLMGGVPLWLWVVTRGDGRIVPGVQGTRARSEVRELRDLRDAMARAAADARRKGGPTADAMPVYQATHLPVPVTAAVTAPVTAAPATDAVPASDPANERNEMLVAQLERLAALHRAGDLSIIEFQQAKRALLAEAPGPGR